METKSLKSRFAGAAIVEMAIVFPLLIWLLLGVLHYGWMFLKAQQITNAARSGARYAICDKTGDVVSYVGTILSNNGIKNAVVTPTPTSYASTSAGTEIKVAISVEATPANGVTLLKGSGMLPTPATLVASVTMVREGP